MSRRLAILLGVALALSLAVNLAVAGFWLERYTDRRPGPTRAVERAASAMVGRMPEEAREPLLAAILTRRAELEDALRSIRQSRRAARNAMAAEPYDAARVEAALAEVRARSEAMLRIMQGQMLEALPKLPADLRRRIADRPD